VQTLIGTPCADRPIMLPYSPSAPARFVRLAVDIFPRRIGSDHAP